MYALRKGISLLLLPQRIHIHARGMHARHANAHTFTGREQPAQESSCCYSIYTVPASYICTYMCMQSQESSCCHSEVVKTPKAINEAYGPGYHFDRYVHCMCMHAHICARMSVHSARVSVHSARMSVHSARMLMRPMTLATTSSGAYMHACPLAFVWE